MCADRIHYTTLETPLGGLAIGAGEHGCCFVEFVDRGGLEPVLARAAQRHRCSLQERTTALHERVASQLDAYFSGRLREFDLPLQQRGTPFERSVWARLSSIPFGSTATYGDIARGLGNPGAARAVGLANGRNPLAIVVPCHRVVRAGGAIGGYGGGGWRKRFLLAHEGVPLPGRQASLDF